MKRSLAIACFALQACAPPSMPADAGTDAPVLVNRWPCPAEWVAGAAGGCGPSVLLCASDGGAMPGACDGIDLSIPRPAGDPDAGGTTFHRLSTGDIGGGWSTPTSVAAAPAVDFEPTAGIDTCAAGWRRRTDGTCDPMLPTDCGPDSQPVPAGGCAPARAADCATGEWADVSAESGTAAIVRVRAGGSDTTGDGSATRPFGTIGRAIERGGNRAWVLLAAGSHASNVAIAGSVHVIGVCARLVTVTAADPATPAFSVDGAGAALDLRGVTVRPAGPAVAVTGGAHGSLRAVRVSGAAGAAVGASGTGSVLDLQRTLVDGTRAGADVGIGLVSYLGAHVTVGNTVVADSATLGISCRGAGAQLTFADGQVRTTRSDVRGSSWNDAIDVAQAGSVTVRRSLVDANGDEAGVARDARSALTIEDSVVTGPTAGARGSWGISVHTGASLQVRRTLFDHLHWLAIVASGRGTVATVADSVVRGTVAWEVYDTTGIQVTAGARLDATRVLVDRNLMIGIYANDHATLNVDHSIVRNSTPSAAGTAGIGVAIRRTTTATVTDSRVDGNANYGVLVQEDSNAVLERIVASGSHGTIEGTGHGVLVGRAAQAILWHGTLTGNRNGGTTFDRGSLDVRDSQAIRNDDLGLAAITASTLRVARSVVGDSQSAAVVCQDEGSLADIADTLITGPTTSTQSTFGRGLEISLGCRTTAVRVLVRDTMEFGIEVGFGSTGAVFQDVIVAGVAPSSRGFGLGVGVLANASASFDRIAIESASGAGMACLPASYAPPEPALAGGVVDARDVMVHATRSSTVQYRSDGATTAPTGQVVAYGLHVGPNSSVDAQRATIVGGGYGVFAAYGTIALRTGVIAHQLDGAAAFRGTMPVFENVTRTANARDETIESTGLPEGASLPPPAPICPPTGCL